MGKPIVSVTLQNVEGRASGARAVFDTGSHYSLARESSLPPGTQVLLYPSPKEMKTAAQGGVLRVKGTTHLVMTLGDKMFEDEVMVSTELSQEVIVGAGTMQKWDVTIRKDNGHTTVLVGRDMRDPDVLEVDAL